MSPENPTNPNDNQLFTVPADEFKANYRPLTPEELTELGLTNPESTPLSPETLTQHDAFISDTFKSWTQAIPTEQIQATLEDLTTKDYPTLEKDIDTTKAGEYTLNPETQTLDFETATIFIPDLSAFNGKKLSEVAEHLISTYSDKYYFPGIEYWHWLCAHKNLADLPADPQFNTLKQELTDNYCFLFGSTLRYSNGHWYVPCVLWVGSKWNRNADWLGNSWYSDYRVVLLER
ncbi:MAG: hypothetical protein UT40_C0009G0007 [Candidatus Woesebacteria bacterium GW2011_GWA1_39_21b]|uniref:Uncharacterized protein n=1 Tax=Candidatus Woesebacteria bacterium GW2011_GWA1_39_21b TaxID=1618551 RepID=A0A0G0RJM7_9BACT|nr:MAG: hypothetical protein UT40_C0009G0007 [Candidatus Woesebacteria bacterium GW2011_GWA1_39_21b]KKS77451.1 MAG: hypothetical protein UV50_C0005G0006 [Parcubacteria group bacterium GW2011_GWB1_42_9]